MIGYRISTCPYIDLCPLKEKSLLLLVKNKHIVMKLFFSLGASTELSLFPVSSFLVQDVTVGQGQCWLVSQILKLVAIYYCIINVFMAFPLCYSKNGNFTRS